MDFVENIFLALAYFAVIGFLISGLDDFFFDSQFLVFLFRNRKQPHITLKELKLAPEQCCYCGDDLPDLPVMQRVGLSIAVANAHAWVRERARWRTQLRGGEGAVREVCDLLLAAHGKADEELARFT